MLPLLTFVIVLVVGPTGTHADDPNGELLAKPWFDSDCNDPRYKTVALPSLSMSSHYLQYYFRISNAKLKPVSASMPCFLSTNALLLGN
jgi:hypothetical protein